MKFEDYYVYLHTDVNSIVFYVGSGRRYRARDKTCRNKDWHKFADSGYSITYIASNLTKKEALSIETDLIENPKTGWQLTNKVKPLVARKDLTEALSMFKYDENSPSGLVYSKDVYGGMNYAILSKREGDIAGSRAAHAKNLYWKVKTNQGLIAAHRIIWAIFNGVEGLDENVVNHINNDTSDNRIENLELVSMLVNMRRKSNNNGKLRTDNKSGFNGVYKHGLSRFVATHQDSSGEKVMKSFNINKLGEEEAYRQACEWRVARIKELNEQGAGYTERHGT